MRKIRTHKFGSMRTINVHNSGVMIYIKLIVKPRIINLGSPVPRGIIDTYKFVPYKENRSIRDLCHMGKMVTKDTERIFLKINGVVLNNCTEIHHKLVPYGEHGYKGCRENLSKM